MEVLRRCPLAIAQQLVYYANAVLTAVLGRVTSSMSVAPLLSNNLKQKRSPTFVAQLHLPTHDLFWANLKVHLHLPPLLRSLDPLLISPGTLSERAVEPTLRASLSGTFLLKEGCRKPVSFARPSPPPLPATNLSHLASVEVMQDQCLLTY